ncbi:hypothetical protein M6B38_317965 [Iris pallida]|uniref:Uncharacterized protein n=1 Tax=Iris pallida TaxID=29817 RepID=A0AAX6HCQ8_IRIPA|nr:hypothetical protein M6B38_317965 [Iris pallida]
MATTSHSDSYRFTLPATAFRSRLGEFSSRQRPSIVSLSIDIVLLRRSQFLRFFILVENRSGVDQFIWGSLQGHFRSVALREIIFLGFNSLLNHLKGAESRSGGLCSRTSVGNSPGNVLNSLFTRLCLGISFNSQLLCRFMYGERVFESLLADEHWCPICVRVASCGLVLGIAELCPCIGRSVIVSKLVSRVQSCPRVRPVPLYLCSFALPKLMQGLLIVNHCRVRVLSLICATCRC